MGEDSTLLVSEKGNCGVARHTGNRDTFDVESKGRRRYQTTLLPVFSGYT